MKWVMFLIQRRSSDRIASAVFSHDQKKHCGRCWSLEGEVS